MIPNAVVYYHVFFFFHERLTSLFIVCQTMLTIGELRLISEANERERQAREHSIQQAAEKPHRGRFTINTPLQQEWRLEIGFQSPLGYIRFLCTIFFGHIFSLWLVSLYFHRRPFAVSQDFCDLERVSSLQ